MLNQWEEESAAGCLSDLNHIDNAIREANRGLKSLDQEFTNEVKQLTVVQVSYGFGDDLWPALFQFFSSSRLELCSSIACQSGLNMNNEHLFLF